MHKLTYNGREYPVHFGLRAINQFAKQTGGNFSDVITTSEAITAIDAIVSLGALGLNEGARKEGLDDRYTEDELWEWCDDDPSIVLQIADIFIDSIRPLSDKLDGLLPKV